MLILVTRGNCKLAINCNYKRGCLFKGRRVFSCKLYNSGHRGNYRLAVDCNCKKGFSCKLYSSYESNCMLTIDCNYKRGLLAVNCTKVDSSYRRQSKVGYQLQLQEIVFLLLQTKGATTGNLRYSTSNLLDPFSPYLPNKDISFYNSL